MESSEVSEIPDGLEQKTELPFGDLFDGQILKEVLGEKFDPGLFKDALNSIPKTNDLLSEDQLRKWYDEYMVKMPHFLNRVTDITQSRDSYEAAKKVFDNYTALNDFLASSAKGTDQTNKDAQVNYYEYIQKYNNEIAKAYPEENDRLVREINPGILTTVKSYTRQLENDVDQQIS